MIDLSLSLYIFIKIKLYATGILQSGLVNISVPLCKSIQ